MAAMPPPMRDPHDCLTIENGRVFDPLHGVAGERRTVHVAGGRITGALPETARPRRIDASGLVVMPGGVDIHCHIASTSVNAARAIRGEEHTHHVHAHAPARGHRGGTGHQTPSTFTTGYRYAGLGYTTAMEAAVSPTGAPHTHWQLEDTPNLDAGFLLLVANHEWLIRLLAAGERERATAFIGQLLRRTGAWGLKVVNPGGVAAWRHEPTHHTITSLDEAVAGSPVTPRALLEATATAAETLALPHGPHIHANRLGLPGNVETTIQTLDALAGRRAHLAHLQYHAYGRDDGGRLLSAAGRLIERLEAAPEVTADVGAVLFGEAVTLTADTPLEHLLWRLTGKSTTPYFSLEGELETGCGIMPLEYRQAHGLHALQWAIGLELMLGADDPWRMMLSTDHPNGGSFLAYPRLIAALMNRAVREELIAATPAGALDSSDLPRMSREMTLGEIAIVTRAAPARALGMTHKGHLGPGADADLTLYHDRPEDPLAMFESPRYVVKGGRIVVEDGELRAPVAGATHRARIERDASGEAVIADWFEAHGSYDVSQFGVSESVLAAMRPAPDAAS